MSIDTPVLNLLEHYREEYEILKQAKQRLHNASYDGLNEAEIELLQEMIDDQQAVCDACWVEFKNAFHGGPKNGKERS